MKTTYPEHLHALDGLRGVAALSVLLLHGAELSQAPYVPLSAGLAVDLFFMLSGFVLALAYDVRLGGGSMSWRDFMVRRVIRLYPMILVGALFGGAVLGLGELTHHHVFGLQGVIVITALSVLLLPAGFLFRVDRVQAYPANNPMWSLFFEVLVGAVYAIRVGKVRLRLQSLLVALLGIALIYASMRWHGTYGEIGFATPIAFCLGVLRVFYPFAAGVLLFRARHRFKLPRLPIFVLALATAGLLLGPVSGKTYSLCTVVLVWPALLALALHATMSGLSVKICSMVGELSYPLYLIHQPVLRVVKNVFAHSPVALPWWCVLAIGVIASSFVAQGCLVLYDRPMRAFLARRYRKAKDPAGGYLNAEVVVTQS